jgi:hypothetical protein
MMCIQYEVMAHELRRSNAETDDRNRLQHLFIHGIFAYGIAM